jgi:hypothetical protein
MGAPFSGRLGIVESYDKGTHAYLVHVDGGNPRHLYRENIRIAELNEEELKLAELNRKVRRTREGGTGRPRGRPRNEDRLARLQMEGGGGEYLVEEEVQMAEEGEKKFVEMGDQLLLSIDGEQFTALELLGLKRVDARVLALAVGSEEVPKWMQRRSATTGGGKFQIGDAVYAQASDGKFYAGKIKHETKEKFLIEWTSEEKKAGDKWIRKCAVCRRTALEEMQTRPGFFAALAVASAKTYTENAARRGNGRSGRGGGRGRATKEEGGGIEMEEEEEEGEVKAGESDAVSVDEASELNEHDEYESSSCTSDIEHSIGQEISRSTWKHQVLPAIRLLRQVGISAYSDVARRETFEFSDSRLDLEDSFFDWLNVAARTSDGRNVATKQPRPVLWASEVADNSANPSTGSPTAAGVGSPASASGARKRGIAQVVKQPTTSAAKLLKTASTNNN